MRGGTPPLRKSGAAALAGALLYVLALGSPASAQVPQSLKDSCERRDAADDDLSTEPDLPYFLCDDGVPDSGGRDPNEGAVKAVPVPQNYGLRFEGLPAKSAPQPDSGADSNGNIALDADLSFPDPNEHPVPAGGYPLVVFMHGCCAGSKTGWEADTIDDPDSAERWHYSNAWFASRGYAVLTYTARGFVDESERGSTGVTEIDDRRFEINDYQHLAGLIAEDSFDLAGEPIAIDPQKIITTGGSYGGGFSWLSLTDPTWESPNDGIEMRLAATAPKYGWTDLVYSLVPTGTHRRDRLPARDGSDSTTPLGFPKQSIVAGLYASGTTGVPPGSDHATFPESIDEAFACVQSTDPFPANPLCDSTLRETLPSFIRNRSAYYQDRFFQRLRNGDPDARVPIFSAGTLTDPLFTSTEHRRMVERILRIDPGYPVQEYYGDYQHFTQNKRKEWSDLCGEEVCAFEDYPGRNLDAEPEGFTRLGVNTRLNRFIDHFVAPPANPDEPEPAQDVTAALQICPENATERFPEDEPGRRFSASSFDGLAPETLRLRSEGTRATTSKAAPNPHALSSDPVGNSVTNGGACPVESTPAGPGVATYTFDELEQRYTMIGRTRVRVEHSGSGSGGVQLNARLYDVFPNGDAVMVDRGVRRLAGPDGTTTFDLHGNGWRFREGHRVRIELAQDDAPFIKSSTQPSSLTLSSVTLRVPVRETTDGGGSDPPRHGPRAPRRDDPPGEPPGGDPPRSGGDRPLRDVDCRDFHSRGDAQLVLDADTGDPFGLDADGDGTACEALLAGVGGATGTSERAGRLPFTGSELAGLALAGLALAGGGWTLRRRLGARGRVPPAS